MPTSHSVVAVQLRLCVARSRIGAWPDVVGHTNQDARCKLGANSCFERHRCHELGSTHSLSFRSTQGWMRHFSNVSGWTQDALLSQIQFRPARSKPLPRPNPDARDHALDAKALATV